MPEGPSIVILREELAAFAGKRILRASGTARIDTPRLVGKKVRAFRSWGKHFLIELGGFTVRIHFLLFGKYTINESPRRQPHLHLVFRNGQVSFQAGSIQYIEGDLDQIYDWRSDVMADEWDPALAREKLRGTPETLVCDALLDQNVFAGVGNIIKNEVLFRVRVHPLSKVGDLPATKLRELVTEARRYSFQFFEWKKAQELKKHWLVHTRIMCPRCKIRLQLADLGRTRRRTFYCSRCQIRYATRPSRRVTVPSGRRKSARTRR